MSPDTEALLKWATLAIAVIGAVLGVVNTWRAVRSDRIRLRVRIRVTLTTLNQPAIEVVNLSDFPVTVVRAGWAEQRGNWPRRKWVRTTPMDAETSAGSLSRHPIEIEPRRPQVITFSHSMSHTKISTLQRVFVTTACGVTVRSPAIPDSPLVRFMRGGSEPNAASQS